MDIFGLCEKDKEKLTELKSKLSEPLLIEFFKENLNIALPEIIEPTNGSRVLNYLKKIALNGACFDLGHLLEYMKIEDNQESQREIAVLVDSLIYALGVRHWINKVKNKPPDTELLKRLCLECKKKFKPHFSMTSATILLLAHFISEIQGDNFAGISLKRAIMDILDIFDTDAEIEITKLRNMRFLKSFGKKQNHILAVNIRSPVPISVADLCKIVGGTVERKCRNKVASEFFPCTTTVYTGVDEIPKMIRRKEK